MPYPSYSDPDYELAALLKTTGPPDTAFYDATGELVYMKLGQYANDCRSRSRHQALRAAEGA